MAISPIRTLYSMTIGADEARYILASYGPNGVGVRFAALYERAAKFTRMLWEEGYFREEDGRWEASKWRETDFIIQKDPGPVDDRITDLEEDEQRLATTSWWLVNICQQLEAMQLWFQRPLDAEPQYDVLPTPIAPSAVESAVPTIAAVLETSSLVVAEVETVAAAADTSTEDKAVVVDRRVSPEILRRIEQSRRQKVLRNGKKTPQSSSTAGTQAVQVPTARPVDLVKLLPMQKTHMLRLRPAEVIPLYESVNPWLGGVQFDEIKVRLGNELATILLEHHFLVQTEVSGQVVFNLLMFAATELCISEKNPRLIKVSSSPLSHKGLRERLGVLVKLQAPVIKPKPAKPKPEVSTLVVTPEPKPAKPPPVAHLQLRFTYEEAQAICAAIDGWTGKAEGESMCAALGEDLFRVLRGQGYIIDHDEGGVTLDHSKFVLTLLMPRHDPSLPVFGTGPGLLPAPDLPLAQRFRRLLKSWRKHLGREVKQERGGSSWVLYLKIEEIRALLQDLDRWLTGVSSAEVQAVFGEEVATLLSTQGFLLRDETKDDLWSLNQPLIATTSIQVWVDSKQRIFPAVSTFSTHRSLRERLEGMMGKFNKKAVVAGQGGVKPG